MIWEDLAWIVKTLFIMTIMLLIVVFLTLALNGQSALGQEVRETPSMVTPAPSVEPTRAFVPPTPVSMPIVTTSPNVIGPALVVECSPNLECEATIYPNTSTAFLVLAVDSEYLTEWEKFSVPSGWGVRLWFDPPACIGSVSTIQLMEGEDGPPVRPMPPSPVLASYNVAVYCAFLPDVH